MPDRRVAARSGAGRIPAASDAGQPRPPAGARPQTRPRRQSGGAVPHGRLFQGGQRRGERVRDDALRASEICLPVRPRNPFRPQLPLHLSRRRTGLQHLFQQRRGRYARSALRVPACAHRRADGAAVAGLRVEFRPLVRLEALRRTDQSVQHGGRFENQCLHQSGVDAQLAFRTAVEPDGGRRAHALLQRKHALSERRGQPHRRPGGLDADFRPRRGPTTGGRRAAQRSVPPLCELRRDSLRRAAQEGILAGEPGPT